MSPPVNASVFRCSSLAPNGSPGPLRPRLDGTRDRSRRHGEPEPLEGDDRRAAREPSGSPDTSTGRPSTSARICSHASFASSACPVATTDSSPPIASSTSASRYATPSSAACAISPGVVANVRPSIEPAAARVPAERALAAEERQERQPVRRSVASARRRAASARATHGGSRRRRAQPPSQKRRSSSR